MAENEFHRGDVWWFRDAGSYANEYGNSRPGVIVSSERGCETSPTVQVVLTTTAPNKYGVLNVPLGEYKGRKHTAMCATISTFSKERATDYMYSVEPEQLAEIDRGLTIALGLQTENVSYDENTENLENEISALKVENAMYQKLYEKALDQLASMKLSFDLEKKSGVSTNVAPAVRPAEKPKAKTYDDPGYELVDVNRCKFDDLKTIGVSTNVALNIISARPFMKVDDLRLVPGLTKVGFGIIEKKVTVGDTSEYVKPKQPKKKVEPPTETVDADDTRVNINTASAMEISNKTGLNITIAYGITGHRKRNGLYKSVNELLSQPKFTEYHMKKFGHLFYV